MVTLRPGGAAGETSPADDVVVSFLSSLSSERPDPLGEHGEPIALLHPKLGSSLESGRSVRVRGERREEGNLVDHEWQLARVDMHRPEHTVWTDPHRPDRLSQLLTLDLDLDLQPHPPEHVEQTKSSRVQAHAPDREVPARERGGSEEESRGGRISRDRAAESFVLERPV